MASRNGRWRIVLLEQRVRKGERRNARRTDRDRALALTRRLRMSPLVL